LNRHGRYSVDIAEYYRFTARRRPEICHKCPAPHNQLLTNGESRRQ